MLPPPVQKSKFLKQLLAHVDIQKKQTNKKPQNPTFLHSMYKLFYIMNGHAVALIIFLL